MCFFVCFILAFLDLVANIYLHELYVLNILVMMMIMMMMTMMVMTMMMVMCVNELGLAVIMTDDKMMVIMMVMIMMIVTMMLVINYDSHPFCSDGKTPYYCRL